MRAPALWIGGGPVGARELQGDREVAFAGDIRYASRAAAKALERLSGDHRAFPRRAGVGQVVEAASAVRARELEPGRRDTTRRRQRGEPQASMRLEQSLGVVEPDQGVDAGAVEQPGSQ